MCLFSVTENQPANRNPKTPFSLSLLTSTMARKRLTNSQKLRIVADAKQRLQLGESLKSIARSYDIQPVQIRKWTTLQVKLSSTKQSKKSLNQGFIGRLDPYEDEIMLWASKQRDAGFPLAYHHLVIKAGEVFPEFLNLTKDQQYNTVRRLCRRNYFHIRRITHVSQRDPNEIGLEALQWLEIMRPERSQ